MRFFELAAQILPVLLLAFALEFRFFTPGTRPGTGGIFDVSFLFLVLALGEWVSLDAVAAGAATENEGTGPRSIGVDRLSRRRHRSDHGRREPAAPSRVGGASSQEAATTARPSTRARRFSSRLRAISPPAGLRDVCGPTSWTKATPPARVQAPRCPSCPSAAQPSPTTRSFGLLCSACKIAACHFRGRSSKSSALSSASWNSRRSPALISTSGGSRRPS
jgi:hypothetical protein